MVTSPSMGWRLKLITLAVFGLLTLTSILSYNWYMEGFSIGQLRFNSSHLHLPPNSTHEAIWSTALAQPYHYLGKGCQFYAFESEDHQYVIKLLKGKHVRSFPSLESLPMPAVWKQKLVEHRLRKTARVQDLIASCHLALTRAPRQTGLLYVHSQPESPHHAPIQLYDAIGWPHRICLDSYIFLVQEKAQPLTERLYQLTALPEPLFIEQVSVDLQSLVHILHERSRLAIRDLDRSFVKNVGLSAKGAVWIDIGQWVQDVVAQNPDEQAQEVQRRFGDLLQWAAVHIPDRYSALQQAVDRICFSHPITETRSLEQSTYTFDSGSAER